MYFRKDWMTAKKKTSLDTRDVDDVIAAIVKPLMKVIKNLF
jgi:hypothetical protein